MFFSAQAQAQPVEEAALRIPMEARMTEYRGVSKHSG